MAVVFIASALFTSLRYFQGQLMLGIGAIMVLSGVYLRWQQSHFVMKAEDEVKDGRLTEEQARRRLARLEFAAPAIIVVGLTVCTLAVAL